MDADTKKKPSIDDLMKHLDEPKLFRLEISVFDNTKRGFDALVKAFRLISNQEQR